MRLGGRERHIIRNAAEEVFGSEARVLLFGSRVDDARRGGDIDLLILLDDSSDNADMMTLGEKRVRYLVMLEKAIGEQKIDLITALPGDDRAIVAIAVATGVEL
ncbi:nucleotidyltransferase domain-containing protein [Desulfomicrobium salsuginis]